MVGDSERAATDLAEEQWGLLTRRQAQETGMAWTTLARLNRDGRIERVAHGVYRLRGAPPTDHLPLRAAWLQLAPDVPAWRRDPEQGVVSHRSAAAFYGLGHLPADIHQFILPVRRQSRRADVQLRRATLTADEWTPRGGLLVTRPARIAADLLADLEDAQSVGQVIADALAATLDEPRTIAAALGPRAATFGLARGDGVGLLEHLLDLTAAPRAAEWTTAARG